MSPSEQRFIDAIQAPAQADPDLQGILDELRDWQAALEQSLQAVRLDDAALQGGSTLARRIAAIHQELDRQQLRREEQWQALGPARALAQDFEGKLMLLVFGKFNAGKSSLCNFLAARFGQHGQCVQYFRLEGGQLVPGAQAFHEGATETTSSLQGVCLGDGLVLLDTPGLHSATDDNAALTQRFLDSADAVLWLTSSTSPGQVQELDELARELRRGKPLLPVLTRSDVIEEDEADGQIIKCLRNKSAASRAAQEADVRSRAADKLQALGVAVSQLKAPVSVSAHVARSMGADAQAMEEAGFERFHACLAELLAPALAYRARKPAEVLLHHLQEEVVAPLAQQTLPALAQLRALLEDARCALPTQQARIVQLAWREVMPELSGWLQQHTALPLLLGQLEMRLSEAFDRHARACLAQHVLAPATPFVLELAAGIDYRAGAQEDLPLSYEQLYESLGQLLQTSLVTRADALAERCAADLVALEQAAERMQALIDVGARQLGEIAGRLRSRGR